MFSSRLKIALENWLVASASSRETHIATVSWNLAGVEEKKREKSTPQSEMAAQEVEGVMVPVEATATAVATAGASVPSSHGSRKRMVVHSMKEDTK